MTVEPLLSPSTLRAMVPDEPLPAAPADGAGSAPDASFAEALGKAFGAASTTLEGAERAERAFASGRGSLQEMVLQRAQADVALSLASAAASRAAQALTTILGMAV